MSTSPDTPVYLDHAAATPLDPNVLDAMTPYFSGAFFNPSSPYAPAVAVRRAVADARAQIGRVLGVRPGEIVFTSGATESVNLAFHGVLHDGGSALVSTVEHQAVLNAARHYPHHVVTVSGRGEVDPRTVAALIGPDTRLVSVALANNELGTIQPLGDIGRVVRAERERRRIAGDLTPIWFHSDASQGAGLLELIPAKLGVDLLTLNAAKMHGPKGVGLLWAASEVTLVPQLYGGGQERGLRSGTENVPGIIGFAAALEKSERARKAEVRRVGALRDDLQDRLTGAFPDAVVTAAPARLANFLHIAWPGLDAERIVFMLENDGVLAATGSACAANEGTRSHVLTAVGMPPGLADGSLRLTLGASNDETDIERAAAAIITAVTRERGRAV